MRFNNVNSVALEQRKLEKNTEDYYLKWEDMLIL